MAIPPRGARTRSAFVDRRDFLPINRTSEIPYQDQSQQHHPSNPDPLDPIMIASNSDLKTSITPSLPHPKPCLSYWQRTTRAYPHLNANKSTPVPASNQYVVIGSGISGALTAFELTENGVKGEDIVILEAREAASGASSRNAGHVRPGIFSCCYLSFVHLFI